MSSNENTQGHEIFSDEDLRLLGMSNPDAAPFLRLSQVPLTVVEDTTQTIDAPTESQFYDWQVDGI